MSTKLTDSQRNIINLMANGWELGLEATLKGRYWIQKGGLGYGGEAIHDLNANTIKALIGKNLITISARKFPNIHYRLTALGKSHAINI